MPRIVKQAQAEQDLLDIWLFTFNNWGEERADNYLDSLASTLEMLNTQPLVCRERTEFSPPVRIHHHAHHLIVYLLIEDGINIIRVLHEKMDINTQLE